MRTRAHATGGVVYKTRRLEALRRTRRADSRPRGVQDAPTRRPAAYKTRRLGLELRTVGRVRARAGDRDGRGAGRVGEDLLGLLRAQRVQVRAPVGPERAVLPEGVDRGRAEGVAGADRV